MEENLRKIFPFIKPYQFHVIWNVIYNILYALFSTLSFISLIPMMQVLFGDVEEITKKPVYTSIWNISKFGKDYLYFHITELQKNDGPQFALLLVITLVITTFLFKMSIL